MTLNPREFTPAFRQYVPLDAGTRYQSPAEIDRELSAAWDLPATHPYGWECLDLESQWPPIAAHAVTDTEPEASLQDLWITAWERISAAVDVVDKFTAKLRALAGGKA